MLNIRCEFIEKLVTVWIGMRMVKNPIDRRGIKEFMKKLLLPKPGQNREYSTIQIVEVSR